MPEPYRIVRSGRKTMQLSIDAFGRLTVRVPRTTTDAAIAQFLSNHADWIKKHMPPPDQRIVPLTQGEVYALADRAVKEIPPKVRQFAAEMGVSYGQITIRNQRTRWGSCSGRKNLNFNCLLLLVPEPVMDYVIVHELCHLIHLDHSKAFWATVEKFMPDYKTRRAWLDEHGGAIIARLP